MIVLLFVFSLLGMEIAENMAGDCRACHLDLEGGVDARRFAILADGLTGLSAQSPDRAAVTVLAGRQLHLPLHRQRRPQVVAEGPALVAEAPQRADDEVARPRAVAAADDQRVARLEVNAFGPADLKLRVDEQHVVAAVLQLVAGGGLDLPFPLLGGGGVFDVEREPALEVVDVSGAGRGLALNVHFSEAAEAVSAYGLSGHRHLPEMVQEIAKMWPKMEAPEAPGPRVSFTPHLIPITRGILSTCYASLIPGQLPGGNAGKQSLRDLYVEAYAGEAFVKVVDAPPSTKHTRGNNMCLVSPTVDERNGMLVAVGVLDNLVKGAAGQAIENMNLMLGIDQTAGLDTPAVYP